MGQLIGHFLDYFFVMINAQDLMAHSDQGFRNGRAKTPQAPDNKLFLFVHSYAPSQ